MLPERPAQGVVCLKEAFLSAGNPEAMDLVEIAEYLIAES